MQAQAAALAVRRRPAAASAATTTVTAAVAAAKPAAAASKAVAAAVKPVVAVKRGVGSRSPGHRDTAGCFQTVRGHVQKFVQNLLNSKPLLIASFVIIALILAATTMSTQHVVQFKYQDTNGRQFCAGLHQEKSKKGEVTLDIIAMACSSPRSKFYDVQASGTNNHLYQVPGTLKNGTQLCVVGNNGDVAVMPCKACAEFAIAKHHALEKAFMTATEDECKGAANAGLEQVWHTTKEDGKHTALRNGAQDKNGGNTNQCMKFNAENKPITMQKCSEDRDGKITPVQSWFVERSRIMWV